jgi:hypothetical protein
VNYFLKANKNLLTYSLIIERGRKKEREKKEVEKK